MQVFHVCRFSTLGLELQYWGDIINHSSVYSHTTSVQNPKTKFRGPVIFFHRPQCPEIIETRGSNCCVITFVNFFVGSKLTGDWTSRQKTRHTCTPALISHFPCIYIRGFALRRSIGFAAKFRCFLRWLCALVRNLQTLTWWKYLSIKKIINYYLFLEKEAMSCATLRWRRL